MTETVNASLLPVSRFDTSALSQGERFQAWRESIGVIFEVGLDKAQPEAPFDASVTTYMVDSLLVARCASRKQSFERSPLKVSRDGLDHYLIQIFVRGQCESPKGHQDMMARAGDIWVNDLAQNYSSHTNDFENISLVVPRSLVSANLARPDQQHQRVIPGDQPLARLFKQMVLGVFENAPSMTVKDGLLVSAPMLRMVEGLLNSREGGIPTDLDGGAVDHSMLAAVKRFIEANLTDPALRSEFIISHMGISRSSLYRLFEPVGGVASYIRARRLRSSVRDLMDPAMARRRIYEIAYDWGFTRESDYARAFRRHYGLTPREARTAGMLSVQSGESFRGLFGDRDYEGWVRDLVKV